jgi:hypothetical protein
VDRRDLWDLLERAGARAGADAVVVAGRAAELLAALPPPRIVAAAQPLWDLMAESYQGDLWGAAYLINGGASDDGFDYFRGWLIAQGPEVFSRAVADPDALAEEGAVQAAAAAGEDLWGEEVLGIVWNAHLAATGQQLPPDASTIHYPTIDFGWDFDDHTATRAYLPRLSRLYLH